MRVVAAQRKAWPQLAALGDPRPVPGATDVLVRMRVTNRSRLPAIPFVDGTLDAVGRSTIVYESLAQSCGALPHDYQSSDTLGPGESAVVTTCWQVARADAASLLMWYDRYAGGGRTFFALR